MRDLPPHFVQVLSLSILAQKHNPGTVLLERMRHPDTNTNQLASLLAAYKTILDHDTTLLKMACNPTLDTNTLDTLPNKKALIMEGVYDLFFQSLHTVHITS